MLQDANDEVVIYYLAGTIFMLLLVSVLIVYIFLHQKKVNAFRLHLQQKELDKQKAIYAAWQEGEEKERNRIAEELHDGVCAKLSGLNMNLDYLRMNSSNNDSGYLISKTFTGISETINELRAISHNLQPKHFSERDIHQLISEYIEHLNATDGCRYELFYEANGIQMDGNIKLTCYRVITELLQNVHKHAHATKASIQLIEEAKCVQIIVEDNGVGFNPENDHNEGIGLQNIRKRVSLNNGILNIDSSPGGTTIIIEINL